ncbi:carbohydrate kinase [Aurantimonas sp. Leaf443]|uniref:carbohydrate kinase family protein n=1 Tax=Aurantimonas sp. Leaf443 TaxID=1736378 RepID=UPI0006F4BBEF|nr:carbohydrate kinase [Aurantimonas sp. Leaf443]KQT85959.1 carbohydrate kinase [Aurantimonas sp. Leaf443]
MFLSCGDALFDLFAQGDDDVSRIALNGRIGGSPLNVALGLARLGHHAAYFTKISSDLFGQRIRAFMEREAIDQRLLVPTDRNTTLAMVSLKPDGSAAYVFYIDGTADRSIEVSDVPNPMPAELEAIHLASYSTVTEPTAGALVALLRQENDRRFVSYDPNVRASIEPDLDIWRAKVAEIVPHAALVKASDEDLEQLYPGRAPEAVLADWIGAVALSGSGLETSIGGRRIVVADTVGAGDTFQAALLAGLKERSALSRSALLRAPKALIDDVLDFAANAAAVTCSRRGADLPRRADLGLPPLA